MIKLYITAIESNIDGTAITLFEDYLLGYDSKEEIEHSSIGVKIARKIDDVEEVNNQTTSPF